MRLYGCLHVALFLGHSNHLSLIRSSMPLLRVFIFPASPYALVPWTYQLLDHYYPLMPLHRVYLYPAVLLLPCSLDIAIATSYLYIRLPLYIWYAYFQLPPVPLSHGLANTCYILSLYIPLHKSMHLSSCTHVAPCSLDIVTTCPLFISLCLYLEYAST